MMTGTYSLLKSMIYLLLLLRENGEGTLCNSDKVPKLLSNSTPITCVAPLSSWILYIFNHSSRDFLLTKVAQP